jgi:hypothetical protein
LAAPPNRNSLKAEKRSILRATDSCKGGRYGSGLLLIADQALLLLMSESANLGGPISTLPGKDFTRFVILAGSRQGPFADR